jgi:hypothetical protein
MSPRRNRSLAHKSALLASGRPWIVPPEEVAKCTKAYSTDPEILLACIVISGTLDTAELLRAIIHIDAQIALSPDQERAYQAFRRVWANPTPAECAKVIRWAEGLVQKPGHRWRWPPPQ